MMTFQQFLASLAGGVGASALFSWISERVPAFQKLEPQVKWWFELIGTVVIALGAYTVSTFVSTETLNALAPWFGVIALAYASFKSNQLAHRLDSGA
jgi:uncharacterized membrane protein YfcA